MRKEIDWAKATKILLGASLVVGGVAYSQSPETQNAFNAFFSPDPECGQAIEQPPTYEAIVVFTTQQFGTVQSTINLELYKAAAQAYVNKPDSQVILLGNLTGYEVRVISEQIKLQVTNISDGQTLFDLETVQVLPDSVTFSQGMEFLSTNMEANGFDHGIGIADATYANRLSLLAGNFKTNLSMVPVACNIDHTTRATDLDDSDLTKGEKLQILALALDPDGTLTTKAVEFFKDVISKPE